MLVRVMEDRCRATGTCVKICPEICTCEPELVVIGYPNEFKHVVLNIVNNAKDAIENKKKKELFDQNQKGRIIVELSLKNDKVIIEFKDNGGGIAEKELDKIFLPYFTSKQDGTGIGLYMSKIIIEDNMDGKLYVRNSEEGAIFTIELLYIKEFQESET